MNRLKHLILEIHRRSLWQVLGIYVVGSRLGYEVILNLTDGVGLPDWVPAFAIVLFVIGLPIVLATAFVQERAPATPGRDAPLPDPTLLPDLAPRGTVDDPTRSVPAGGRRPPLLTWRRALGAGALAFLVLGLSAAGYVGMRAAGIGPAATLITRGDLAERDRIILADFDAGDAALATALTEALRVDLEQSPAIRLAEPAFIREALARMQRDAATPMTEALARELATREGVKAVIAGEVGSVGGQVVLSARIIGTQDGSTLVAVRETASDSAAILPALDRLSRKLRERIGESLRTVRTSEPLEQVTTGSLEALRNYSEASRLLRYSRDERERAFVLLEEAIALDSTFAMAHLTLGTEYGNLGMRRDQMVAALTRAYQNSQRLGERERNRAAGAYHANVTHDRERAIAAYASLIERYPDDGTSANNLAVLYASTRQDERAVEMYRRALALDSMRSVPNTNLVVQLARLKRFEEASTALEAFHRRLPEDPEYYFHGALLAWQQGEHEVAIERMARYRAEVSVAARRGAATAQLGFMHAALGRIGEAETHLRTGMRSGEQFGAPSVPFAAANYLSQVRLLVLREPADRALEPVEEVLRQRSFADLQPLDRPYTQLAYTYGWAGRTDRARALLTEFEATLPDQMARDREEVVSAQATIALGAGRPLEAVTLLQQARASDPCLACYNAPIAHAFDAAAMPDSAIAWYERYLDDGYHFRTWLDGIFLAHALERLGVLHEQRGDRQSAARYTARFTELWANADPELRPRVEAARSRLAQLIAADR